MNSLSLDEQAGKATVGPHGASTATSGGKRVPSQLSAGVSATNPTAPAPIRLGTNQKLVRRNSQCVRTRSMVTSSHGDDARQKDFTAGPFQRARLAGFIRMRKIRPIDQSNSQENAAAWVRGSNCVQTPAHLRPG
jgi:hypothetical protein